VSNPASAEKSAEAASPPDSHRPGSATIYLFLSGLGLTSLYTLVIGGGNEATWRSWLNVTQPATAIWWCFVYTIWLQILALFTGEKE